MINHRYNFLYIRVAKTASTSILSKIPETHLIENSWEHDINHIPLWFYKNNILTDSNYNKYFKFAFVRNPFDRAVSIWKYYNAWVNKHSKEKVNLTFKETICAENEKINQKKFKSKYGSQFLFTQGCDFIGKYENIQEDFNTVCDKIGIPQQQLPQKNKTTHKHYSEYYDDETKQIVSEIYAKDIEYFQYKFGE